MSNGNIGRLPVDGAVGFCAAHPRRTSAADVRSIRDLRPRERLRRRIVVEFMCSHPARRAPWLACPRHPPSDGRSRSAFPRGGSPEAGARCLRKELRAVDVRRRRGSPWAATPGRAPGSNSRRTTPSVTPSPRLGRFTDVIEIERESCLAPCGRSRPERGCSRPERGWVGRECGWVGRERGCSRPERGRSRPERGWVGRERGRVGRERGWVGRERGRVGRECGWVGRERGRVGRGRGRIGR